MKNAIILIGLLLVALAFIAYRYHKYGKSLGWSSRYDDIRIAAKKGYYLDENGRLVKMEIDETAKDAYLPDGNGNFIKI